MQESAQRMINPCVLHFQKLALELTCPLCLRMFNEPMLLPCNHIFCKSCTQRSVDSETECLICNQQYRDQEVRPAPYMENFVTIFRNMDATFSASRYQPEGAIVSLNLSSKSDGNDKLRREDNETLQEGNSSNGQPSINVSDNDVVDLSGKLNRCSRLEICQKQGLIKSTDLVVVEKQENLGMEDIGTIQIGQLSPPSFGDVKERDGNCSDPNNNNQNIQRCSEKRLVGNDTNVKREDAKRQKLLSNGLFGMGVETDGCHQSKALKENVAMANRKLESKLDEPLSIKQTTEISNTHDVSKNLCVFCHSYKETDGSGPLLHYANGKEIKGNMTNFSNVKHVHEKCISWTPQVYFEGGTIKNLESEVARADKLKCSSCGKKGAALGCFVSSCRRTYHVPCAYDILDCRWDCDDFLLLCPKHASQKFPNEKLMARKQASKARQTSMSGKQAGGKSFSIESSSCAILPSRGRGYIFCGSALSSEQKCCMVEFARDFGVTVSKYWRSNVTHVIAATGANGACTRTFKVLMAILNGKWVVTTNWLKACAEAGEFVNEEPYEVGLDNHGCSGGPRAGRLGVANNAPKLFNCMNFYFLGEFVQEFKSNLIDLVITAGGSVIESKEELQALNNNEEAKPVSTLIVYNTDTSLHHMIEDEESIKLKRWAAAEDLARATRSQVIGHPWILESIAACSVQSLPSS